MADKLVSYKNPLCVLNVMWAKNLGTELDLKYDYLLLS